MATIQSMCAETRLRCDDPLPNKPSLRRVLLAVLDATQSLYNQLSNTGQSWSLKPDYSLIVSSNTSDYLLAVDDSYGKPVQVITSYPSNPDSFIPRYVEFREFNSLNFDWPYPQNLANWLWTDGSNCTAMRMAFYYQDDGSRYVRVLPQPALTATYLITFASGDWVSAAAMDSSPVLSQFHSLVEIWAAESILPSCQWWADEDRNIGHRKELATALKNDEARISDEFLRYIRNLVVDQIGTRRSSFDDEGYGDWGM